MSIFQFYDSAAQIQVLANIAHNVPGYLLCFIAVLFLAAEYGYHRERLAMIYSAIFIAMPVSFMGYIFVSNGITHIGSFVAIVAQYPEVYLHIFTLVGNLVGGVGEILYVRGRIRYPLGALLFPILFLVDGFLSILHPHGAGGHHDLFHNVYGSLMVLAGLLVILERLIDKQWRTYFIPCAALAIFIPGVMLATFKEPADAYTYAFLTTEVNTSPALMLESKDVIVYISDSGVVPHDIGVHRGTVVHFIKTDDSIHDIASGPHPQHSIFPPLNIGVFGQGQIRSVTFDKLGLFGYHDHIADGDVRFQGTVTVVP